MGPQTPKRVVICVDAPWYNANGELKRGNSNQSSIYRIWSTVKQGKVLDENGHQVEQSCRYFSVNTGLKSASVGTRTDEVLKYCQEQNQGDELWFFGYSQGALIIRAVIHLLCCSTAGQAESPAGTERSPWTLKNPLRTHGLKELQKQVSVKQSARESPIVRFVGLFDTIDDQFINTPLELPPSSAYVRHAVALHETQPKLKPILLCCGDAPVQEENNWVEAWFVGSHIDIGGGPKMDGLSLYPLQWMLVEARNCGLVLKGGVSHNDAVRDGQDIGPATIDLLFPQEERSTNPNVQPVRHSSSTPWVLRFANKLTVEMYDMRNSHHHGNIQSLPTNRLHLRNRNERDRQETNPSQHYVSINKTSLYLKRYNASPKARKMFDTDSCGKLMGYQDGAAVGALIHPSVYFIMDCYPRLVKLYAWESQYVTNLETFRSLQLLPVTLLNPWAMPDMSKIQACRILVCGSTGVGKSTLLNAVFGIPLVPVSHSGMVNHDVEEAFESDRHPGIIIHDSRGFQVGMTEEVQLLKEFLQKRSTAENTSERLHAIWLCIEVPSPRTIQQAHKDLFDELRKHNAKTPVIVVRTKKDQELVLRRYKMEETMRQKQRDKQEADPEQGPFRKSFQLDESQLEVIKSRAEKEFYEDERQFENDVKSYHPNAQVHHTSSDDMASIEALVKITLKSVQAYSPENATGLVASQRLNVHLKVELAIKTTADLLNYDAHVWRNLITTLPFANAAATPILCRILCNQIFDSFGLERVTRDDITSRLSKIVLYNLTNFMWQNAGQDLWNFMMGVGQVFFSTTAPLLKIWPAARMVVKCACDLILILERAIRLHGPGATADDIERAQQEYASGGSDTGQQLQNHVAVVARIPPRDRVHRAINQTFPLQKKFFRTLGVKRAESLITDIIRDHRIGAPARRDHSRQPSIPERGATLVSSPEFSSMGTMIAETPANVSTDEPSQPDQSSLENCDDEEFEAVSQALDAATRQDPTSDEDGGWGEETEASPPGPEDEVDETDTIPDSPAADSEASRVPTEDADSWSGGLSVESLQVTSTTPDDDQALEVGDDSGWGDDVMSNFP